VPPRTIAPTARILTHVTAGGIVVGHCNFPVFLHPTRLARQRVEDGAGSPGQRKNGRRYL